MAVVLAAVAVASGTGSALAAPAAPEADLRNTGVEGAIADAYIVVFKAAEVPSGDVPARAHALARRHGAAVGHTYGSTIRGFSARMTEGQARRLAADPTVEYVEADAQVRVADVQSGPPSWGLDRIDQRSLPLSSSYEFATTAAGVTAYVIDTGIRVTHTDFGGRAQHGYDFVDGDADVTDCNGHGTHVAGTIGGTTHGGAKGVSLVGVRVLDCAGSGAYSGVIAGVDWVAANAARPAVANMSLGGPASSALDAAVRGSIASGVTYAIAAGNSNADACRSTPARVPEAITVGATTSSDARASFSNYGSCLDLFAPGAAITSTWNAGDTATNTLNGTSMAAPHAAGAAALVLAGNPTATPQQVRDALVGAATAGAVTGAGRKSPNLLLYTGAAGTPEPEPDPEPGPGCPPVSGAAPVAIPDRGAVDSPATVTGCAGNASATSTVEVHITHPSRGDLVIDLVAPDGTALRLKNAAKRDTAADVAETYTVDASAVSRNGGWLLRVRDQYSGNVGILDSWTLTL